MELVGTLLVWERKRRENERNQALYISGVWGPLLKIKGGVIIGDWDLGWTHCKREKAYGSTSTF